MNRRWLAQLLADVFSGEAPPSPHAPASPTRVRRSVIASMAARGVSLGVPLLRSDQRLAKGASEHVTLVRFLVVVAEHIDLAARLLGDGGKGRHAALATALALVYGTDDDAQVFAAAADVPARAEKALSNVERELTRRRYLQGNPIVGLLLLPALTAIDGRALVLTAIDVYGRGHAGRGSAEAIQKRLAAERLAVVAAIARLSEWREVIDADIVRSASIWQAKSLGLPRAETQRLVEQAKSPADLSRLVTLVPDDARERVFLHTVLAAWADGRKSKEERDMLRALASALGIPDARRRRVEARVVDVVRRHGALLDPIMLAAGFAAASPPISVRVARLIQDNLDALLKEIKETGDLAVLLARRAAGQPLADDEQRRMREQLMDVVKAVPSLAVFALPGGFVLLPILLKLLPIDLRLSSWKRGDHFHALARGQDDALTADDLSRAEQDFLERL